MSLPVVAIVGRPNVGKSSLLNSLARKRISIVDATAGVTRDRISTICQAEELYFELIDTGGFGIEDHDNLTQHVEQQIRYAIEQAAVIVFVVDAREGVLPLDQEVAQMLRSSGKTVIPIANKVDELRSEPSLGEFCALGFGEPLPMSAHHHIGRRELLERIAGVIRVHSPEPVGEPVMKIAVVGRRNAGKSTFINALAGEQRVIVSEVPGTTRDAIDVRIEKDNRILMIIDTAGVRKKGKFANDIEYYGHVRARQSILRADVVLLFIDASVPVGQVEKKLGREIADALKPCILVINKWDLARGQARTGDYEQYLEKVLPGMSHAPIAVVSASRNEGTLPTLDLASELFKQSLTRVSTADLNRALETVTAARAPTSRQTGQRIKIYYGTQVSTQPPTLVFFVNHPKQVHEEYRRFLLNRLRELLPFSEIPIRLMFRSHRRSEGED